MYTIASKQTARHILNVKSLEEYLCSQWCLEASLRSICRVDDMRAQMYNDSPILRSTIRVS